MNLTEETLIICARIQDQARPILGSVQRQCAACGCGIWVSPSTVRGMISPSSFHGAIRLQCGKCAIPVIIREKSESVPLTPDALNELANEFARRKMGGAE